MILFCDLINEFRGLFKNGVRNLKIEFLDLLKNGFCDLKNSLPSLLKNGFPGFVLRLAKSWCSDCMGIYMYFSGICLGDLLSARNLSLFNLMMVCFVISVVFYNFDSKIPQEPSGDSKNHPETEKR
jgi:hypothetical protein